MNERLVDFDSVKSYLRKESCWRICAAVLISVFMLALYLYRPHEGWPRLALFALGVVCVPLKVWGVLILLLVTPSLETLTLKYGLPNQFLFENAWLGYAVGCLAIVPRSRWRDTKDMLLANPYVLPLVGLVVFTFVKWIFQFYDLVDFMHEGVSKRKMWGFFARNFWLWNEKGNPFHDISIAIGTMMGLAGLWAVYVRTQDKLKLYHVLLGGVLLTAIPVHLLAYLQKYHKFIYFRLARDTGGAFQNGNVYSFYSGLLIIVGALAFYQFKNRWLRASAVVVMLSSCFGLLVGKGRTSWVALVLAVVVMLLIWGVSVLSKKLPRPSLKHWAIFGSVSVLGALILFWGWDELRLNRWYGNREFDHLINKFSWRRVWSLGGRFKHFRVAWSLATNHPFSGVGFGYFLSKHSHPIGIHNIYLSWIVGCGWWILVPILYGKWLYLKHLWQVWKKDAVLVVFAAGSLVFIFLGQMFDHYIDYRSVASMCLIILALPLVKHQPQAVRRWVLPLTVGLAIIFGVATCGSPHTFVKVNAQHSYEEDSSLESGRYRWSGPHESVKVKPGQCGLMVVKSVFPKGDLDLQLKVARKEPGRFTNLTMAKELMAGGKSYTLKSGRWVRLCGCHSGETESWQRFQIFANSADYLSISRHDFGVDDRYIAFGISEYTRFSDDDMPEGMCDYLVGAE